MRKQFARFAGVAVITTALMLGGGPAFAYVPNPSPYPSIEHTIPPLVQTDDLAVTGEDAMPTWTVVVGLLLMGGGILALIRKRNTTKGQ